MTEYVQKTLNMSEEIVTCTKCSQCYAACAPKDRTFCQEFSFHVDPADIEKNKENARGCDWFTPDGIPRHFLKTPPHERWYEKDNAA